MLMLAPVIRVIARMDIPSTSMARIWVRFDIGSLFIALRLTSDSIWLTFLVRTVSSFNSKVDKGGGGDWSPR